MTRSRRPIHAISFDLWDTLVVDDSDEAERARRGLASKADTRRSAFRALALRSRPELPPDTIDAAFQLGVQTFRRWWKVEHHTPPIAEWLKVGLDALDIDDPTGLAALADDLGRLEVEVPPQPVPSLRPMLDALHGRVPLAIVSDTINTPADGLRSILRTHDLERYFDVFAFSDEVGASKPAPDGFALVTRSLSIEPAGLVHVGDRQETDVDGIQRFGGRAVMYTGAIDRHGGDTTAEVTCADYAHFLAHLDTLGGLR